jgi:hypothetical protein
VSHRRKRRLIAPGGAFVPCAVDNHVVELDAMRAFAVECGLLALLQKFNPNMRVREIVIAALRDDVVALGDGP